MSLNPTQTLSLLKTVLREHPTADATKSSKNAAFSNRLDQALEHGVIPENTPVESLQKAADLLRLEALRTSLNLLDNQPDHQDNILFSTTPSLTNQTTGLQAYISNQLTADKQPAANSEKQNPLDPDLEPGPKQISKLSLLRESNSTNIDPIIDKASRQYGVDPDLIRAVIKAESNFNPRARSHAGAQGLMQLMPATAKGLGVTDPFNAEQNVMGGTKFLKGLLERYNGNLDSALAAYNWGPGNVDKRPDRLPRETREYLVKVKQYYNNYQG